MKRIDLVILAALALAVGCSDKSPRASEDPTYEDSDVAHEEIKQVFPPFAMQTVACVPFVNKSLSRYKDLGNIAPDVLPAMLIEAGFRVVEGRGGQLDEVLNEANYGQSEFVDPKTAAKIGKQLGARYVFIGGVTDYNEITSKGGKKFDALGLVQIGGSEAAVVFNVAVSSRIVDVETREVMGADSMTRKKQKFETEGGKFKILGVGTENKQELTDHNETMGAILRLAFATSLNKVTKQLNMRAQMVAPPTPGAQSNPVPGGAAPAPPASQPKVAPPADE